MNIAVEYESKYPIESCKGTIVVYDVVDGVRVNIREANAKELLIIVTDFTDRRANRISK